MHRKFIAFIVSAAIAVTGISAGTPARADSDTARLFAGLTALAIIGLAINDHNKRKRVRIAVSRNAPPRATVQPRWKPRPLPPRFHRYTLPRQCLRQVGPRGDTRLRLGRRCLERNYDHTRSLPSKCYRQDWTRRGLRQGYGVNCLLNEGYRLSRN
ncbi:hypothetical protein [Jhaorihella thermophila]|uniref:Uncharacterized protein n=1 Tax=Jhaorihella thermophila TaxID=488547 RepID=A0A1H5UXB4_9RHOB|nr:hypothetical protein [Jhaorihella thermophila]SEF79676.1 hypothetical protein SAMN05421751_10512 [Jhaorihella thermophila]